MDHPASTSDPIGALSLPRKTILVVDDEPAFRELVVSILGKAGYQVDEAADGSEVMGFARENRIDLLITDIVMPNREGIETIQYFSKLLPKVPVIAVSGSSSYLRPAKVLGATATLEKTSVADSLLPLVRSVIGE
jgi:CheY-like chemotaxis protein